ncbi:MAG: cyclase [Chloroflexota bacterium]
MVRVFLRHEVADYAVWRSQYDTFGAERRAMGVIGENVFRNAEDDHEITVTHDFETLAAAERFVSPRHLREAKAASGAAIEPSIWFAEL